MWEEKVRIGGKLAGVEQFRDAEALAEDATCVQESTGNMWKDWKNKQN